MRKHQRGQSLSEYLLILGLIAVTSIAVVGTLGSTIRSQVAAMTQELAGIGGSPLALRRRGHGQFCSLGS